MIAAGVVCQTMSHNGYGWCVTLLTLLATGAQGQDVDEPWKDAGRLSHDCGRSQANNSRATGTANPEVTATYGKGRANSVNHASRRVVV